MKITALRNVLLAVLLSFPLLACSHYDREITLEVSDKYQLEQVMEVLCERLGNLPHSTLSCYKVERVAGSDNRILVSLGYNDDDKSKSLIERTRTENLIRHVMTTEGRLEVYELYSNRECEGFITGVDELLTNATSFSAADSAMLAGRQLSLSFILEPNSGTGFSYFADWKLLDKFHAIMSSDLSKQVLPSDLATRYSVQSDSIHPVSVYFIRKPEIPFDCNAHVVKYDLVSSEIYGNEIRVYFDEEGAKWFGRLTKSNVGSSLATAVDSDILFDAKVVSEVPGGITSITCPNDPDRLRTKYAILKGGRYYTEVNIVEENKVKK